MFIKCFDLGGFKFLSKVNIEKSKMRNPFFSVASQEKRHQPENQARPGAWDRTCRGEAAAGGAALPPGCVAMAPRRGAPARQEGRWPPAAATQPPGRLPFVDRGGGRGLSTLINQFGRTSAVMKKKKPVSRHTAPPALCPTSTMLAGRGCEPGVLCCAVCFVLCAVRCVRRSCVVLVWGWHPQNARFTY